MKGCSISLGIREMQIKPQLDIISDQPEQLKQTKNIKHFEDRE